MKNIYSATQIDKYLEKQKNGEKVDIDNYPLIYPIDMFQAKQWDYKFWSLQPVPNIDEVIGLSKIVDNNFSPMSTNVTPKPYNWKVFDINHFGENIVTFYNKHYNNQYDRENKLNQVFTVEYLRWLLGNNGHIFGISTDNNVIGGLVCVLKNNIQVYEKEQSAVEICHMCLHKNLRKKGLTEVMFKELMHRNLSPDTKIGYFSTTHYVPQPISKSSYYFRPMNFKKLVDSKFLTLEKTNQNSLDEIIFQYKIIRRVTQDSKMTNEHVDEVYALYCEYLEKYNMCVNYTIEQFRNRFINKIVHSYVIINDGKITDFYSFMINDYKSLNKDETIKVAQMLAYTSIEITPLTLFKYAIVHADDKKCDMFVCEDNGENYNVIFDNLNKFESMNTYVYNNLFNWKAPFIAPDQNFLFTIL
jgi:hypothetical protein